MGWTDERVADLKKLWLDGLSASQIAKQLGGVTRNAVIGKVHRLGLSGRAAPSQPSRPAFRAARPRPAQAPSAPRRIDPAPRVVATAAPSVPAPRPAVLDLPGTATVLTLGAHMCKWPIGDPSSDEFSFCGRRSDEGQPYCVEHSRVAYQPAQKKNGGKELARSLRRYI
ncbi:MAG TPA: GcrA family cell cycle regulator [Brevundimonas sp.]|jgi:GcrA cell cycle regulator|uniref:cell cycle sigma 70 cofactor GcrA n=1 Tax=Brevundimonas sp. TaxID=1871086 RepID=UPI002C479EC4|nr:GcrA family cell cycle regulator [Brevundimonas sp.]HRH19801.1 GcrA family cell cycle regulator [Brevundimonas sp.]